MKPVLKYSIWTLVFGTLIGLIALPKVLPLLRADATHSEPRDKAVSNSGSKSGGGNKGAGGKPLKVSTYVVHAMPFAETVTSTGTLRADEGVELQAEINGKIVAINFVEGSRVRKGDLLLKLNDADLRATLARATYRRELAQVREKRYAQLLSQKVVTQDDYDTALNEVNVQDAEIELNKALIAKTEIRAPFDGVAGLRFVSTGAYVNATTRIATLQRLDTLKIDFSVPEKYAGRIKAGSPITFRVAGGGSKFTGQIYATDPRIDSGTRTLLIRAVCRNEEGRLLPGAFANVEFVLSELSDAVLIPSEAVVPGIDEKNVFVVTHGKAELHPVETGTRTASTIHVLSGLHPGDVVITSGLVQMRDGQAVEPLNDATRDAAAGDSAAGSTEGRAVDKVKKRNNAMSIGEATQRAAAQP